MIIQMGCLEPLWGRLTAGPQQPAFPTCSLTWKCLQTPHWLRGVGAVAGGKERTTPPIPGRLSWAPRRAAHGAPLGRLMSCWPKDVVRVGRRQRAARQPESGTRSEDGPSEGSSSPVA